MTKNKIYILHGYFGYWGIKQHVSIPANSYKEATKNLKKKVMKLFKGKGKGRHQEKFYCKVVGYQVIEEVKDYFEFKTPINYK